MCIDIKVIFVFKYCSMKKKNRLERNVQLKKLISFDVKKLINNGCVISFWV